MDDQRICRGPGLRATAGELHAALVTAASATEVLERLSGAQVTAARVRDAAEAPDGRRRDLLELWDGEALRHRRSLLCAQGEVLVVADLWYVPARLPADRVHALTATVRPFGGIMRGLGVTRRLLASSFGGPAAQTALRHHVLLIGPDGKPVGEVIERYRRRALSLAV